MSFKKLNTVITERLAQLGFEEPLSFQKSMLPKLKGGASIYAISPRGSGKTTALIIYTIHKLGREIIGDSPRALIMVKNKEAALTLKEQFEVFTKNTDLRLYCAYEEYDIDKQRDDIYYGVDILIVTPKRLNKLYYLNSLHLGELKLFAIEDAEFLIRDNINDHVHRVTESIQKCQYVICAEIMHNRYERLKISFMHNALIIS